MPWSDDNEEQCAYQAERARGGVAMCVLGGGAVHPSSPGPVPTSSDRAVPGLRALADAVRPHGARMVLQLRHAGSAKANGLGGAPWSCGVVPHPAFGVVPVAMSRTMIDDIVAGFAAAARRAQDALLDGVEVHGASGYLVNQFLSPATNHRTDEYGGSLPRRLRFVVEILDAIRAEVGTGEFVVGLRLTSNEFVDGGVGPAEAARVATALQSQLDYLHVTVGSPWRPEEISPRGGGPVVDRFRDHVEVTRAVSVPTVVSGGLRTIDDVAAAIAGGVSDLAAMTRALIADPRVTASMS